MPKLSTNEAAIALSSFREGAQPLGLLCDS